MPFPGENAMTRLPKDKRDKLILTVLGTGVLVVGMYFGLIRSQQASIRALTEQKEAAEKKARETNTSIQNSKTIETDLARKKTELTTNEEDMASGDPYLWMLGMIRQFQPGHDVDISTFSAVSYPEVALFPRYPYKQVAINIGGTAYYHDLGKFIADFENRFKHMRIQDVSMEPPAVSQ